MELRSFIVIGVPLLLILCIQGLHGQTVFTFQQPSNLGEAEGPAQVCVEVQSANSPVDTLINVTSLPNTAEVEDFSPQDVSLFFAAADITVGFTQCFNVTITNDTIVEAVERIEYGFDGSNPSSGVILGAAVNFVIFDDDVPIVSMGFEETTVLEGRSNVSICVNYTGPSGGTERTFQAQVLPESGTAIFETDFFIQPTSPLVVMFPVGTLPGNLACGPVEIQDDNILDGNKNFRMMLEEDSSIIEVEPLFTNVTILDDDNATLTVQQLPPSVSEGGMLTVCVGISGISLASSTINIPVVLSLGGDTSDSDFNPPSSTLQVSIPAFTSQGCSSLTTAMDDIFEGNETLTISIESSDPMLIINTPPASTVIVDGESVSVGFLMNQISTPEDSMVVMVCAEMTNLPMGGTAVPVVVTVEVVGATTDRCNPQSNARLGVDYSLEYSNITFPPAMVGPRTECLNVTITDDTFAEEDESFELELSSTDPSNALIQGTTQTEITITDDDIVTLETLTAASVVENADFINLLVFLGGPASNLERDINITVDDVSGTAVEPNDYSFSPLILKFLCEDNLALTVENGQNVSIMIQDDLMIEDDESFVITYSSTPKNNVNETRNETTVTILSDDFSAGFTITELSVSEDIGVVELTFEVAEGTPRRDTLFTVSVGDATATLGADFYDVPSNFTLGPGTLQTTVEIRIINDSLTEVDEFLVIDVTVSDVSVTLLNNSVNVTIDSEDMSVISLRNITTTAVENTTLQVCIDLEGSLPGDAFTVELMTTDGTANSGSDFSVPGDLVFTFDPLANESCREPIDITLDQRFEDFETFTIAIVGDSHEDVTTGMPNMITITITNADELQIAIQPEMQTISEVSGSTNITGMIQSVPANGLQVAVNLQLGFSMSVAGLNADFSVSSDTLMFPASPMPSGEANIVVTAVDDLILEGNEDIVFDLLTDVSTLPGLNVSITDDSITIIDDEVVVVGFVNATLNISETEGRGEVCIAPMSVPAAGFSVPINVSVDVVYIDPAMCSGSGNASSFDFIFNRSNISFPPNSTEESCLEIIVINDTLTEGTESFSLQITVLSPPDIATPGNPSTVNILDNDKVTVSMSMSTLSVPENVGNISICAELAGDLCTEIDISVQSQDSAVAVLGGDYSFISPSEVTFGPGSSTGAESCVNVSIIDDLAFELDHSFTLELMPSDTSVTTVPTSMATTQITIMDNENVNVSLSSQTLNVTEGQFIEISVNAELPAEGLQIQVTVDLSLVFSGDATGDDASLSPTSVTFPLGMGVTQLTTLLSATADGIIEFTETFTIEINQTTLMQDVRAIDPSSLDIDIINVDGANLDFAMNESLIQFHGEAGPAVEICFQLTNLPAGGSEVNVTGIITATNGSAIEGRDFSVGPGPIVFPANDISSPVCINITLTNDIAFELNETFNVSVVSAQPDQIIPTSDSIQVIILDDEVATFMLPMDRSVPEKVGETEVCIIFTGPTGGTEANITVMVDSVPVSADSSDFSDFTTSFVYLSGSTFPQTSMCFNITIIDDKLVEAMETFQVMLSSSTSDRIDFSNNPLTITIISDDASVRFSNASFFASEGQTPTICVEIFEGQLAEPAIVMISASSTLATAGSDFMLSRMVITLGPDTEQGCAVFQITSDLIKEVNETVSLSLSSPNDTIVISTDPLNITITSNDTATISFTTNQLTISEGSGDDDLCAVLTGATLSEDLIISLTTQEDAITQLNTDYTLPTPFQLVFSAGSVPGNEQCVTINVIDDDVYERTHGLTVSLDDPGNPLCRIGTPSQAQITILDNEDVTVSFNISTASLMEGNMMAANVMLDVPPGGTEVDVIVNITVTEGTGEADDIALSANSFNFSAPILFPTNMNFDISALSDNLVEEDEETVTISIDSSNVSYSLGTPSSINVTIINIDGAAVSFEQSSLMTDESSSPLMVCLEISNLVAPLQDDLSITIEFINGTALEVEDFNAVSPIVVFTSGAVSGDTACATVSIIDDDLFEVDELFQANLSRSSISTIVFNPPSIQSITITDNEVATFSVQPAVSVLENQDASVCITLDGPPAGLGRNVTLNVTTTDGLATAPADYQSLMDSVTFPSGSTPSFEICTSVSIVNDLLIEGNEDFLFNVTTSTSRVGIDPSSSVVTIIDDDLRVQFLNESVSESFPESDAPTFTVCINVTQGVPSFDHNVSLAPDPSATAMMGSDYVIVNNPITIGPTVISGCFDVIVLNDDFFENDDSVSFTLSTDSPGLQIDNGFLNLTIVNDDFVEFEFNHTKYVVNETSNTQVCVRPVPGGGLVGPDVPMNVTLTFRNRTAYEGLDFSFDSGLDLSFDGSSQVVCTPVTIVNDAIVEFSEYFVVMIDGTNEQVEVVIHDPDVCPNVETGPVCEDTIFLRVCNSLRAMNRAVPRSCTVVLEEYDDVFFQP